MVGDDATDKVGVGVVESSHETTQLLLVELANGTEHTSTGIGRPKATVAVGAQVAHTNNVS